jgi:serine/threonine protein kinase
MYITKKYLVEQCRREASIMQNLSLNNAPYVIKYQGQKEPEIDMEYPYFEISMEYLPNGRLSDAINIHHQRLTMWYDKLNIMLKITIGLASIHKLGYLHCDLNSLNILFNSNYDPIICDFGFATPISSAHRALCGTLNWASPEALQNKKQTEKSDIYSLGMIFWEIATDKTPPYKNTTNIETQAVFVSSLVSGRRETLPSDTSDWPYNMQDLIKLCWHNDPNKRLNIDKIQEQLNHSLTSKKNGF